MPMNSVTYLDALIAEGLAVNQQAYWRTTNTGNTWAPQGIVIHHTGPWSTIAGIEDLLRVGRSDLSGPLCQAACRPDGSITTIAWGSANHAGQGDGAVLQSVMRDQIPAAPGADTMSGNTYFYGLECIHDGSPGTQWPSAQVAGMVSYAAAICRTEAWSANRVIFHKGWTTRKVDPVTLDITAFRKLVADQLVPAHTPVTPTEDDDVRQISDGGNNWIMFDGSVWWPIVGSTKLAIQNRSKWTRILGSEDPLLFADVKANFPQRTP